MNGENKSGNASFKNGGKDEAVQPKKDILDQIKRAESAIKQMTLIKMMSEIKQMANQVLELKEKCTAILAEIGVTPEDIKRVIDFVNNLSSVQLDDKDKERICNWAREQVNSKRKDVEKRVEDKIKPYDFAVSAHPSLALDNDNFYQNMGSSSVPLKYSQDVVLCSTKGDKLEVTL